MSMPALLHAERRQHRWQMAAAWRRCNPAWLTSCLVTVVSHSNQQCVTCVIHFVLQYSPYAVMEWIQIQGICRPVVTLYQLEFRSLSLSLFSYGSMSMISWHALLLENVAFIWNMPYLLAAYGKNSIPVATISFFTTGSKNGLWCSLLYQLEFCYATEDHEDRQRVWKKFTGVNAILNDVLITPSFDNAVLFSEPFHSKGIFSEGIFCGFSVT